MTLQLVALIYKDTDTGARHEIAVPIVIPAVEAIPPVEIPPVEVPPIDLPRWSRPRG